jgi:hypothetical protein
MMDGGLSKLLVGLTALPLTRGLALGQAHALNACWPRRAVSPVALCGRDESCPRLIPFETARASVQRLSLRSRDEWEDWVRDNKPGITSTRQLIAFPLSRSDLASPSCASLSLTLLQELDDARLTGQGLR